MEPIIKGLQDPRCYPDGVAEVQVLETHISWVLLAGEYAYKIKKPLNLGFLDFSTLDRRRHYCDEELRLNRRLAPELYLDVVAVTGSADRPRYADRDNPDAIEYAVRMRRFPQHARLDHQLDAGRLTLQDMDAIAQRVAEFHRQAPAANRDSPYGEPPAVQAPVRENFAQIEPLLDTQPDRRTLHRLAERAERQFAALREVLARRKTQGDVRECHGDLHLANLARLPAGITPFDCIEFNPGLRWIDVISEAAFLVMDLHHRGRADFAYRFLNAYLQIGGDYDGIAVLPYYLAYRAMVRAKVAAIESAQRRSRRGPAMREYRAYAALAERLGNPASGAVILTHGFSGSGKTRLSQALLETLPGVRVRSDVERKRLFGLSADAVSASAPGAGIYTAEASERTYARLAAIARTVAKTGYPVLVDATFLESTRRRPFMELARTLGVPFAIVDCQAPEQVLRQRLASRTGDASEADLAVLERQLQDHQPLTADEQKFALTVDTRVDTDTAAVAATLRARLGI
ncbi:MAG: AAA family ATPase [Gammaproteobacteria bacterium]